MNGTYTQRPRAQMAGGGITNARQGYFLGGIGDFFGGIKDKIVDDIIPNEIKDSPVGAALVGGALVNQFGIPFTGTAGDRMGQNWLGNLLGGVMPGDTQFNTVLGDNLPFMFQDVTSSQYPIGGFDQIAKDALAKDIEGIGGGFGIGSLDQRAKQALDPTGQIRQAGSQAGLSTIERLMQGNDPISYAKNLANQKAQETIRKIVGGDTPDVTPDASGRYPIRWKEPLAIGTAIGAADYLTRSDDTMPEQLSIDPSRFATAEAAMAAPNLRFKPQAQYANVAEGGRIGYDNGGEVDSVKHVVMLKQIDKLEKMIASGLDEDGSLQEQVDILKATPTTGLATGPVEEDEGSFWDFLPGVGNAQGGRIRAQEGGLMDLGGMEKDYRQEGGFVPIGAKEIADDVPARLSKNDFVFTADAVRAAGGGDIDAGAEVMENLMENLEAGGKVSEESQGLEGAQAMYANAQKLQNRII